MVDWNRVKDLQTEVGEDDFEEIIAMFLEEADAVVKRLTIDDSAKSLESDLHFLKGSALNIGLARFAQLCQLGEKTAAAGATDIDLEKIIEVYHQSRDQLLAGLPERLAA